MNAQIQRLASDMASNSALPSNGDSQALPASEGVNRSVGSEKLPDSRLDDCSGGLHFSQQGLALMVADWARIIAERKG